MPSDTLSTFRVTGMPSEQNSAGSGKHWKELYTFVIPAEKLKAAVAYVEEKKKQPKSRMARGQFQKILTENRDVILAQIERGTTLKDICEALQLITGLEERFNDKSLWHWVSKIQREKLEEKK